MKAEWKDGTSYSRHDEERKQTVSTAKDGPIEITVVSDHRDYPGEWVMHCHALGISTFRLKNCKTEADAKRRALQTVNDRFLKYAIHVEKLLEEL